MATKDPPGEELRRRERVVTAVPMPKLPEGTPGTVTFVEGLTWVRYWVRFDNGVTRGSLHRRKLARPAEWAETLARRERGEEEPSQGSNGAGQSGDGAVEAAETPESEGTDGAGAGRVPAHLLERSKQRRAALGK